MIQLLLHTLLAFMRPSRQPTPPLTTLMNSVCEYDADCFSPQTCCQGLFFRYCCFTDRHGRRVVFPNVTTLLLE